MTNPAFESIPFPTALRELGLLSHFGERCFDQYYQTAEEEIALLETMPSVVALYEQKDGPGWRDRTRKKPRPMRYVRRYRSDARILGDLDLDALFYGDNVAGVIVDGDLDLQGSLLNWEIDTTASFLAVRGTLSCANIVAGCADIVVRADVRVSNVIVSTYNHGRLEIGRDAYAKYLIVDDHCTIVGRDVHGSGWKNSGSAKVELRESDWIDEIRPEFRSEFFDAEGDTNCPSGNVDLVEALLEGRDILL